MLTQDIATSAKPSRVVVLGAGGFVGRALVQGLHRDSVPTLAISARDIDLTSTGGAEQLASALRQDDSLIMLAAARHAKGRDTATLIRNLTIGETVCAALTRARCRHVAYVSSDSVYPFVDEPVRETSAVSPAYLYAAMHTTRELMLRETVKAGLAIIRLTQIYGAGDTHNAYGPNRMLRSALAQGRIELFGNGEERRDHLFIDDLVKLLLLALRRRSTGILNFATGQSVSFADLAQLVARQFSRPIEIASLARHVPITHRHFDVTALRTAFPEFTPIPLDKGLARTLAQLQAAPVAARAAASQ